MKKIFLYFSIALMLLGIPVTVFLVGKNQELRKRASPATTLYIAPASAVHKVGDTFSLDVKIDTAQNQVEVVQLKLEYDPTKLQALDITNGALAPTIRVSGKIDESGIASITVGAQSSAQPITESGTVAVVTMKALAASNEPVAVRFRAPPDTYANALGEGSNNVLIGMTSASITIQNADGSGALGTTTTLTPTPTTIASISGTLTPTPTTIASISGTLTPTPTTIATTSALTITSVASNDSVTTAKPTFSGTVKPGYTVTVTIHSDPQTGVAQVDANGNWNFTPTTDLTNGPHTIIATATNPTTGETQSVTIPFVVNNGETATESAIPVTGSVETTLLLIGLSLAFLAAGGLLPFIQRSYE